MKTSYTTEDARDAILRRKLSLSADVTADIGDLRYAIPWVKPGNIIKSGKLLEGLVFLNFSRREKKIIEIGKALTQTPFFPKLTFYLATMLDQGYTTYNQVRSFAMWDNVYTGCILESTIVRHGEALNAYVFCMNLSKEPQKRTLAPSILHVPGSEKRKLTFELGAFRWDVRKLTIPLKQKPGRGTLMFQSLSDAARRGTALATGIMTLGVVRYVPGANAFSVGFEVVAPESALGKISDQIEPIAERMLEEEFERRHSDGLFSYGELIERETVVNEFKWWPKLQVIADITRKSPNIDAKQLCDRLLVFFVTKEYGADSKFVSS